MSADYNEEAYENALIELFQNMGWEHVYGPDVERDWHSPLYDSVLEDSIRRINPKAAPSALNEALLKLRNFENAELKKKNALFMDYLQNGLPICLFELKSPSREQTDASEVDSMGVPTASGGRAIREFACKLVTRMATPFLRVPLSLHCLKATAVPPLLSLTLFY